MLFDKDMRTSFGEERPVSKGVATRLLSEGGGEAFKVERFRGRWGVGQRDPRERREAIRMPVCKARKNR